MYQHLSLRRKGNLGVLDHLIIFVSSKEGCLIAVGFPLLYFPLLDQSYVSERVFTQTHTHMNMYMNLASYNERFLSTKDNKIRWEIN